MRRFLILVFLFIATNLYAQHNPGSDCISCHTLFKAGGTVYDDFNGITISSGTFIQFIKDDGSTVTPDVSNAAGNIYSLSIPDGNYLVQLGSVIGKTWHALPAQASCNNCHIPDGNANETRNITMPDYHTAIPAGNDCTDCHHFPASMSYSQVSTRGALNSSVEPKNVQSSQVQIGANSYIFDPNEYNITTLRPDIFAEGYYSMFDVLVAVCSKNNIPLEYTWDDSRKTHFITKVNDITDNYWYHWSYDAGSGNGSELNFKRANRWDEALWRPGVWIKLVSGEDLAAIKAEFAEEIIRENSIGHVIPNVRFSINPSDYMGNPAESNRITVSRTFTNVEITAHNLRSTGYLSPYSKPFQPGVITSMDIPLSLKDQGSLDAVTGVFYNYFAGNYIDSYYIVELGFPGIGTGHSSGRHGFVYITENGTFNSLPNGADKKLHMTSDINVIHAPDFSYWRWIELGNPYYESSEPTLIEDYEAISRGYNLHAPFPNPFSDVINLSFNIFHPGYVEISVVNMMGREIAKLLNRNVNTLGVETITWESGDLAPGPYIVLMKYNNDVQERMIVRTR